MHRRLGLKGRLPLYHGVRTLTGPGSICVGGDHLAARLGAQVPVDLEANRFLEELDRTVAEDEMRPTGVLATEAELAGVQRIDRGVRVADPAVEVARVGDRRGRVGALHAGVEPRRGCREALNAPYTGDRRHK